MSLIGEFSSETNKTIQTKYYTIFIEQSIFFSSLLFYFKSNYIAELHFHTSLLMDKCLALLVHNISDFDWNINERENNIIENISKENFIL